MKKIAYKLMITFSLMSILITNLVPSVVYASEIFQDNTASENIVFDEVNNHTFTEEEITILVDNLSQKYPTLSKEYLREGVYKQLNGDFSIQPLYYGVGFRSAWQGITVDQMGAAIDTTINIILATSTGGVATALANVGRHEAHRILKQAIGKFFGSWFLNSVALDYMMNLFSPGAYLARLWDQHDAVPNNGRINF